MTATYTFSIATDTAKGSVNESLLREEISASAITIAIDDVQIHGSDTLKVIMKQDLPTTPVNQITLLTNVVNAHEGGESDSATPVRIENSIKLRDYGVLDYDKSRLLFKGVWLDCKTGTTETTETISFPYHVTMLYGEVPGLNAVDGDMADAYAQVKASGTPAGVVGVIIENKPIGATEIKVSTLPEGLKLLPGDVIVLHTENKEYKILEHEVVGGENPHDILKLVEPLENARNINDLVYARLYSCKDIPMLANRKIEFGQNSFGSSHLPPQLEMIIKYKHSTALVADKKIPVIMALYHGYLNGG